LAEDKGSSVHLIVNADDLGSAPHVNEAIFGLMEQGLVRSATMLANGRAIDEALRRVADFPASSFGVHLNATEGVPLEPASGLAPLLDQNGCFVRGAIRNAAMHAEVRRAVFDEWSRQIRKVQGSGIVVSHLDSHHQIHTNPWLFGTLRKLQRTFGIVRVRAPRRTPQGKLQGGFASRLQKHVWTARMRSAGAIMCDRLFSLADYKIWSRSEDRHASVVELMVHPGLKAYDEETALLHSDWWKEYVRAHEIICYRQI
jgi:predicted glycoside hydrolase/deacetylase ChbG (UPF0249 family)